MASSKALLVGVLVVFGLMPVARSSADMRSGVAPIAEPRVAATGAQATLPAPTLTLLYQSHSRWRNTQTAHSLHLKSRGAVGTTFSFVLNEPATVELAFVKHLRGHEINQECVIETRGRHGGPCIRTISKGSLSATGKAGKNTVPFDGHTSRSHKLGPGDYTLEIKAANAAGRSKTQDLGFTIL